ncbi:hypothetical protein EXU57_24425 [Segetibacter sp. 3557_3]|uniref:hypothetical protein n=1 Tax=Segetibacter sp. 3557_3 TaxID=2547429 RepID=UPI001058A286|nr:hypothetical protein [Segetibacter sp. 3557_3]TDH18070.1 hypothetical protein EXU57_24425 [Segetibacter sp. 3557_3]
MHPINYTTVLNAFQEHGRLSFFDFRDKAVFENIEGDNQRTLQLRMVLAELKRSGVIVTIDSVIPQWELTR